MHTYIQTHLIVILVTHLLIEILFFRFFPIVRQSSSPIILSRHLRCGKCCCSALQCGVALRSSMRIYETIRQPHIPYPSATMLRCSVLLQCVAVRRCDAFKCVYICDNLQCLRMWQPGSPIFPTRHLLCCVAACCVAMCCCIALQCIYKCDNQAAPYDLPVPYITLLRCSVLLQCVVAVQCVVAICCCRALQCAAHF